jgi:hypothetical protein
MAKKNEIKKINEDMHRLATNGEAYFADYMAGTLHGDEKPQIRVDLRNGNQIFQTYSSYRSLAPDLIEYIQSVVEYTPLKSHLAITFLLSDDDEELKKRIQSQFVGYFSFDFNRKREARKRDDRLVFFFIFAGIILLTLYGALTAYSSGLPSSDAALGNWLTIWGQILSIASWVFLWEAFDRLFFNKSEETREMLRAAQLANAEIVFLADRHPSKAGLKTAAPRPEGKP